MTTLGAWGKGTRVNLERSLRVGDELGGHMVSGHVDGLATIVSRRDFDGMAHFSFRAPKALAKSIAVKGSVALDGTSLTVNAVEGAEFEVLLIPHTLEVTTWGERKAGDKVNIEVDQMARYAARLIEAGQGGERYDDHPFAYRDRLKRAGKPRSPKLRRGRAGLRRIRPNEGPDPAPDERHPAARASPRNPISSAPRAPDIAR